MWVNKRTAIKRHECESCGIYVEPRTKYVSVRWPSEDGMGGVALCLECAELHEMYGQEPGWFGEPIGRMLADQASFDARMPERVHVQIDNWLERGLRSKVRDLCEYMISPEYNPLYTSTAGIKITKYGRKLLEINDRRRARGIKKAISAVEEVQAHE